MAMKIELHLPRSFDADVMYDAERQVVEILPRDSHGIVPLIGVSVLTDGKETHRDVLRFNMADGKLEPPPRTRPRTKAGDAAEEPPAQ